MKNIIKINKFDYHIKNTLIGGRYTTSIQDRLQLIKIKNTYIISILGSIKKNNVIKIIGFCKKKQNLFLKHGSIHIVMNYGKNYVVYILDIYSPKFLSI
jgi:hypothetical protein